MIQIDNFPQQVRDALDRGEEALLLAADRHMVSPFQAVDWPGTDRRWRVAPHIEAPIECECGGDFDLTITVLP